MRRMLFVIVEKKAFQNTSDEGKKGFRAYMFIVVSEFSGCTAANFHASFEMCVSTIFVREAFVAQRAGVGLDKEGLTEDISVFFGLFLVHELCLP